MFASDRNLNVPRSRVSAKKDQNETQVSSPSTSASRGQSPWHDNLVYINKNTPSNYRASLEKDIKQLQLHLQQEKSMRHMLKGAMGRASSTRSPGHRHFSVQLAHKPLGVVWYGGLSWTGLNPRTVLD
ncbi:Protein of unknown function D [Prunus dulcis]|uniref:Ternary complex factor MIP1 leucine-zipper domain-containing protein n=1 Tax=Prunus dulcis TaxID=3755 RepID=A0A5H2XMB7_PRUDU|nr:Protein of unknown function D [Prunus dulcis]